MVTDGTNPKCLWHSSSMNQGRTLTEEPVRLLLTNNHPGRDPPSTGCAKSPLPIVLCAWLKTPTGKSIWCNSMSPAAPCALARSSRWLGGFGRCMLSWALPGRACWWVPLLPRIQSRAFVQVINRDPLAWVQLKALSCHTHASGTLWGAKVPSMQQAGFE